MLLGARRSLRATPGRCRSPGYMEAMACVAGGFVVDWQLGGSKGTTESSRSAQPVPGGEARPPSVIRGAGDTPELSLVVGRALGTVVVTVEGALNLESPSFSPAS